MTQSSKKIEMDFKKLADRFLAWRLPSSVASDLCTTKRDYPFPREGTCLLDATEAEAMLRHVFGADK